MDHQRFDALTVALASGTSRRRVLRTLVAGAVAGLGLRRGVGAVSTMARSDCPEGLTYCGLFEGFPICVDLASDRRHCGACFKDCASAGGSCNAGTCEAFECDPGLTDCINFLDRCVDLASSAYHCGACGNVCASGAGVCTAGVCGEVAVAVAACDPGLAACDPSRPEVCTNLSRHSDHCGACYNVCASGLCRDGFCQDSPETVQCDPGFTNCNGNCFDLNSNPYQCGACNVVCASGECSSGACVPMPPSDCSTGETECFDECVDLTTDRNNCGSCSNTCPVGRICEGGTCKDLVCAPDQTYCLFPSGLPYCDDLTSDVNCGACGNVCLEDLEVCRDGVCKPVGCPAGQTDCFGDCVDVLTDTRYCGGCDGECDSRFCHTCVDGVCQPFPDGSPALTPEASDLICCGGQNYQPEYAPAGCAAIPQEACDAGLTRCGGVCVDVSSNLSHCGACNSQCDSFACNTCRDGVCTPNGNGAPCQGPGEAAGGTCCSGHCFQPPNVPTHCQTPPETDEDDEEEENDEATPTAAPPRISTPQRIAAPERERISAPGRIPAPARQRQRDGETGDADETVLDWPFDPEEGQWTVVNGYRGDGRHAAELDEAPNPGRFTLAFARCQNARVDEEDGVCALGGGGIFGADGEAGWDRAATRGAAVLAPVDGRITYAGELTPTCRYIGIDVDGHPGYQIVLINVDGAPSEGKVERGKRLGTVATGACGDDDAGDALSMLLFRRHEDGEADPEAPPEGVPFADDWQIAGCAYPDDKRTANQHVGQLVPCLA